MHRCRHLASIGLALVIAPVTLFQHAQAREDGAVVTPLFKGLANYPDLPHASSLCGACYEACPVAISGACASWGDRSQAGT